MMKNPSKEKLIFLLVFFVTLGTPTGTSPSPGWSLFGGTTDGLSTAAAKGDLETVKYLVENGVDINDFHGSPLRQAAKNGHTEVVKYLLEKGANPNGPEEDTNIYFGGALKAAAGGNHLEIMDLLLKAGAAVNIEKFTSGMLDKAAENGHLEAVQKLLDAGADPNYNDGYSLLLAAMNGHLDVVKAYIAAGANINRGYGRILYTAAGKGHLEVVKTLMEARGFDPDYIKDALAMAAYEGQLEVVNFLLSKGADPNKSTALKSASESGHLEIVRILLEAGAKITYGRYPPLHYAVAHGHPDVVALLVQNGADINRALNRGIFWDGGYYGNGWTVMHVAGRFGYPIIKELHDLGAEMDLQDVEGRTPLQISVLYENPEVTKEMQKFCANASVQDNQGKAVLDLAKEVSLRNSSEEALQLQDLINLLKKVMPEQIAAAINNADARLKLKDEFMALIEANATVKAQYEEMDSPDLEEEDVFVYILGERARGEIVNVIEDNYCKAFADQGVISLGTEYMATCTCVIGQGPRMTVTPLPKCSTSQT